MDPPFAAVIGDPPKKELVTAANGGDLGPRFQNFNFPATKDSGAFEIFQILFWTLVLNPLHLGQ